MRTDTEGLIAQVEAHDAVREHNRRHLARVAGQDGNR